MTSYEIEYKNTDETLNDAKAIRDTIDYMGQDKWDSTFGQLFHQAGATASYATIKKYIRDIRVGCMMLGIQGRPVNAIVRAFVSCYQIKVMVKA